MVLTRTSVAYNSRVLLLSLFILATIFQVQTECVNGTPSGCADILRNTKFFPPSSRVQDFKDLKELLENVLFTDDRCRATLSFSACYFAFVPCSNSLPEPACMDNCELIDAIREYFCPDEFRLVLKINNSLSRDLGSLDCRHPSVYLRTTNFSSNCFALDKLEELFAEDFQEYKATLASSSPTTVQFGDPDDGHVVGIVITSLVAVICITVLTLLLIRYGCKRRIQERYEAVLIKPDTAPLKLNIYDDSVTTTTSDYTDVGTETDSMML
ncbi:uncharacterized protein [Dysidea avara]|uniref:uncharacterized protein n=1 Tax=Dysidea avara TaxID=196820 RepID=UPI00332CC49A